MRTLLEAGLACYPVPAPPMLFQAPFKVMH